MLGSAVSSSTPRDFQPSMHIGSESCPVIQRHAAPGPALGCPYAAVGMQRALDSAIGLPRRATSAVWVLGVVVPESVRRSFTRAFLACSLADARQHVHDELRLGAGVGLAVIAVPGGGLPLDVLIGPG